MITASVICDSISHEGKRLTTFELRYPKFIHGEFMTHRVISRNASSSRAVPVRKLIEEVRSDELRAGPVYWGAEQKGMQAGAELSDEPVKSVMVSITPPLSPRAYAQGHWRAAAMFAADEAERMVDLGVHKSIVNRLLEPFSHINVVATATEWDNFFGLRLHKDAQPEMRRLAENMWAARQASTPTLLKPGEWHLPYVDANDIDFALSACAHIQIRPGDILRRVSVARCARVSYKSFETGKRSTVEEDLRLYDKLIGAHPLHASPAEHQATPDEKEAGGQSTHMANRKYLRPHEVPYALWAHAEEHGNFVGWRQYRKMLPGESCAPLPEGYR